MNIIERRIMEGLRFASVLPIFFNIKKEVNKNETEFFS